MKQIIICTIMILSCVRVDAQNTYQGEIDEMDLHGEWLIDGQLGSDTSPFEFPERLIFGDRGVELKGEKNLTYFDFMITNGNKLHLIMQGGFMGAKKFLIVDYEKDVKMTIRTFDGTTIYFLRKSSTQSVSAVVTDSLTSSSSYDLRGVKYSPERGIYVQGGKKYVAK